MSSHHEVNDLLDNIRKELPHRAHEAYEEAIKRAMRQRNKGRRHIARGMLRHNPLLRQEWNRQQEQEGALAIFMLLVGFLGGAALMYLFDPDRGARRRAMIQVEARRMAEEAAEAVEETTSKVRAEVERVAGEAEGKAEDVRDQVNSTAGSGQTTPASTTPSRTTGGVYDTPTSTTPANPQNSGTPTGTTPRRTSNNS